MKLPVLLALLAASSLATAQTPQAAGGTEPQTAHSPRPGHYDLRGQITDIYGSPIPETIISIKGLPMKVQGGRSGFFLLPDVPRGQYVLVVYALGYHPQERIISLGQDDRPELHQHIDFALKEREDLLPTVDVLGRRAESYKNNLSFVGTKTATALKDVPQSIGYVTKELVLDQGATTVNDVVRNISGIHQYSFYNDFSIRGFRATGNRNSGNLINGMRTQTSLWRQSSLANIERVEVIKGPSSALFGNAAPGGVINRVTKKPLEVQRRSLSLTTGSWHTLRAYSDFTGPLNNKKSLLYRLNLGYEDTDGFRDLQGLTSYIVAPSLTYRLSERTQLGMDLVYSASSGKLDRGLAIFGDGALDSRPINATQSAANDYLRERMTNLTFSLSHQLAPGLLFNSTYLYSTYDEDLLEHSQDNAFAKKADGSDDPSRVLMRVTQRLRSFRNNSFNNYLTWDTRTGALKHKLLLGYDLFSTDMLPSSSYIEAGGYLLKNGGTTKSYNAKKASDYLLDKDGNPRTNVPAFDLNTNSGNQYQDVSKYLYESKTVKPTTQYAHGLYLQEQLGWQRLQLLLGLRYEWFTDVVKDAKGTEQRTEQRAFTPRIGLVYSLLPSTNVYGTWLRGFEPQSVAVQSNPAAGGPFDPVESELWELGAKGEYLGGRLSVTAAAYHLTQRNTLYNAGITGQPDLMVPIGEERSRGLELDVAGQLTPYWSITASYGLNEAEITKAAAGTKDLGLQRPSTPRHSGSLWSKFIVPRGLLRGFGFGLGVHGVSERLGQVGRRAYAISYPGYALVNAALYYKVRDLQLQLNLDNLLDKRYFISGYDKLRSFPGAPRSLKLSATYRF
ncbi:TonB-dependent siderophore receptor [Porphyromonas sp.]